MLDIARSVIENSANFAIDILDLSQVTSEFGKIIHPLQILRLDVHGPVPLAVQLLPQLRPWARSTTG